MANSKDRSKHIPIKHNAPTGEFKRPNHADFMTASELKAKEFNGVRNNTVAGQYEFWINGTIEKTVSHVIAAIDKQALNKAHIEVFGMGEMMEDAIIKGKEV